MAKFYQSLAHPTELYALTKAAISLKTPKYDESTNVGWCYTKLVQTSRSFSLVIIQLPQPLRDAVMIFYLVLRGLDTVEDDMSLSRELKIEVLKSFYSYLDLSGWTFEQCGERHEKELLQNFDKVIEVYKTLSRPYQEVIQDITQKMGNGMIEFQNKEVDTMEDYNLYCHYVAGLVGIGLNKLFASSQLEDQITTIMKAEELQLVSSPPTPDVSSPSSEVNIDDDNDDDDDEKEGNNSGGNGSGEVKKKYELGTRYGLANSMGLFLQKTNIIRDYFEDIQQKRIFWPKQIWSIYSKKLEYFKDPNYSVLAVRCLNHLITNAMELVPDVLNYLSLIKNPEIFAFTAIPQVMAIATLSLCYNNPDVFFSTVKIRRGESVKICMDLERGMSEVYAKFAYYSAIILSKIPSDDPNAEELKITIKRVQEMCNAHLAVKPKSTIGIKHVTAAIVVAGGCYFAYSYFSKRQ